MNIFILNYTNSNNVKTLEFSIVGLNTKTKRIQITIIASKQYWLPNYLIGNGSTKYRQFKKITYHRINSIIYCIIIVI